jgi:hypothetical protein
MITALLTEGGTSQKYAGYDIAELFRRYYDLLLACRVHVHFIRIIDTSLMCDLVEQVKIG